GRRPESRRGRAEKCAPFGGLVRLKPDTTSSISLVRLKPDTTVILCVVPAAKCSDGLAIAIEHLERHAIRWGILQVVPDDHAGRWILPRRRDRATAAASTDSHPNRVPRLKEMDGRSRHLTGQLANRAEVVENPERSALGGCDKIAILYGQIRDGHDRQIELQRLP